MRWDRISLLVDDIADDLLRDGYVLWESFWMQFLNAFQLLPPRFKLPGSFKMAIRGYPDKLHGQSGPHQCCAGCYSKMDT